MASLLNISLFIPLCIFFITAPSLAQSTAPAPSSSANNNVTAVLEKGGQYTSFIRLLTTTRVADQLNSQLNNSFNGLTIFCPTDNAFNNLPAGTLNKLSQQEQIELTLFHVLPRYFTTAMFSTVSNPVNTQGSGSEGSDTLNITSSTNQVNISTGVVSTPITNALNSEFPLAMYSVEKVLLPSSLFGPKPPAAAPAPKKAKSPPASESPSSSDKVADSPSGNNAMTSKPTHWASIVGLTLMSAIWGMF